MPVLHGWHRLSAAYLLLDRSMIHGRWSVRRSRKRQTAFISGTSPRLPLAPPVPPTASLPVPSLSTRRPRNVQSPARRSPTAQQFKLVPSTHHHAQLFRHLLFVPVVPSWFFPTHQFWDLAFGHPVRYSDSELLYIYRRRDSVRSASTSRGCSVPTGNSLPRDHAAQKHELALRERTQKKLVPLGLTCPLPRNRRIPKTMTAILTCNEVHQKHDPFTPQATPAVAVGPTTVPLWEASPRPIAKSGSGPFFGQ